MTRASTASLLGPATLLAAIVPFPAYAEGSPEPSGPAADSAPREIVVTGVRQRRDANEISVAGAEASRTPGTQADPVKVVEALPGVARSSFGPNELVLWGAGPEDSRILVDGVEIPQLFHGTGIRATVSGDFLRGVSLSPGAFGAEYGRAVGGLVRLETRELPADRAHAVLEASSIDGSVFASAPLGARLRVGMGARYGWLDRTVAATSARDVSPYFATPRYADFEGKAELALRRGERLELVALGSTDEFERAVSDADPLRTRQESTRNAFERVYLRYRRASADGSTIEVVPWVGRDLARSEARFGANPANLEQRASRLGLRAVELSPLWPAATLALGLDATLTSTALSRDGSLAIPAREGDIGLFGQPPGDDVASDRWHTLLVDIAPYANLDFDLGPLRLSPGLRFDAYLNEASRKTPRVGQTPAIGQSTLEARLEPRLAAEMRLSERVRLFAATGLYSQQPAPTDLSAVFGTPELGVESATHVSAGESVKLSQALSLTALGFYRSLRDRAVRDPAPTPKLARALLQNGSGRSYGVQIFVRQRPWHGFSGWIAYTLSRSERRDAPGARYRLFDLDEPTLLTVVVTKTLNPWSFGARFRFASGAPRTPVVGALFDFRDAAYQPVFGAHNGERLPDFWQLDARIERSFSLSREARLLLYLEGLNITNHANAEEYAYNFDYSKRGVISGLPALAVLGVRLEL